MTGVRLEDVQTGEEKEVACDAVFVSVGRAPATQMLETQVVLDENGYIIADESTRTNLPGVFAVGDIRTKALRQDCDGCCRWSECSVCCGGISGE